MISETRHDHLSLAGWSSTALRFTAATVEVKQSTPLSPQSCRAVLDCIEIYSSYGRDHGIYAANIAASADFVVTVFSPVFAP